MTKHIRKLTFVAVASLLLISCIDHNRHALEVGAPPVAEGETVLSVRTVQTRNFSTLNREDLIQSASATMQDLGFTVGEVSNEFGLLTGSKQRDAVEAGQVAVQAVLTVLAALGGSSHTPTYDESQTINITILISSLDDTSSEVRVFFDRHITNNLGQLWKADLITDKTIYTEFFDRMSQSAFLEENKS